MVKVPLGVKAAEHGSFRSSQGKTTPRDEQKLRARLRFVALCDAVMRPAKRVVLRTNPMVARQDFPGISTLGDQYPWEARLLDAAVGYQSSQRSRWISEAAQENQMTLVELE